MSAPPRPSMGDLNFGLLVAESAPPKVRELQTAIRALDEQKARLTAELILTLQHAVIQGVELFPVTTPAPRAASTPDTTTPPSLAGVGGGSQRGGA